MARFELTMQEINLLCEILASCCSDLRTEIAHTDSRDVRNELKEREGLIKGLMERLTALQDVA